MTFCFYQKYNFLDMGEMGWGKYFDGLRIKGLEDGRPKSGVRSQE